MRFLLAFITVLMALTWSFDSRADQPAVLDAARFASLNKDEIFVRTGPSLQYPIRWVYRKRGLPVEIIREYDTWRQIRDFDGSTGWVHQAMLSGNRRVIIKARPDTAVRSRPNMTGSVLVRLDTGVVAHVLACKDEWCQLRISGFKGWAPRKDLWGIYPSENFQ
jgi:SH3-like domain-containing protein